MHKSMSLVSASENKRKWLKTYKNEAMFVKRISTLFVDRGFRH